MTSSGDQAGQPRIVVVGPCASGKSTLVANLQQAGYDAHVSGQEHSEIAKLWTRMNPDVLVGLRVDLETVRERRGQTWSSTIFAAQERRLADAFSAADLIIDTAKLSEIEALAAVTDYLENRGTT